MLTKIDVVAEYCTDECRVQEVADVVQDFQ